MQLRKSCALATLLLQAEGRTARALLAHEIRRRLRSEETWRGFACDLASAGSRTSGADERTPLTFRRLLASDVPRLFTLRPMDCRPEEARDRLASALLARECVDCAYVLATPENLPACVCWLFRASDNSRCRAFLGRCAPALRRDEVLCEGIYTQPAFRGQRLMRELTVSLFDLAARQGARRALAFAREDNLASLAGARAVGWEPFATIRVRWRWFRPRIQWSAEPRAR